MFVRWAVVVGLVMGLLTGASAGAEGPVDVYRIGQNDQVRIQVFGEDDLTVETKVGGDGTINYPLLGTLEVAGKTVKEVQDYLTKRLAEGYVRAPKVTVLMVRYRNFYLSGEVRTPGAYPFEAGLTVQKAVSMAGGYTEKAELRQVTVTRRGAERTEVVSLGADAPVLPDDIIVVGQLQKFYVTGEVKTPGRLLYEPGMTVQKAISMAGGLTEKGDPEGVKLTRLGEAAVKTLPVTTEMGVLPDDIIVVEGQNRKFYVSGEVKTPGSYPFKEGMNIQKALAMAGGMTDKAEKAGVKLVRQVNGREEAVPVTLTTVVLPEDTIVVPEGQKFFVSGEVKTPGRFLFEAGLTVQKAISMAGGFTEKAEKAGLRVTRVAGQAVETLLLDPDALVNPGDLIVATQVKKFYVEGEVRKPGDFSFEKGLTIYKAITIAGGFTDKAAKKSTQVLRIVNGEEKKVEVSLDAPVLPEDIIIVPQRFF
jgi:protein involved in polysaccharide export with SLBB domain